MSPVSVVETPTEESLAAVDGGDARERVAEELRVIRAKRAELAAKREAAEAAAELERELDAERRALRDEQALCDAIEKHGALDKGVAVVESSLGLVVVRRSSAMKFRRFQDKETCTTEDIMGLVRPCVVHPPLTELDDMLDEQPALLARIGNAVARLAGVRLSEVAKK